jgi:hypothetical protein
LEGSHCGVLSWHLPGGVEENYKKKLQLAQPVSWLGSEPSDSQIKIKSVTATPICSVPAFLSQILYKVKAVTRYFKLIVMKSIQVFINRQLCKYVCTCLKLLQSESLMPSCTKQHTNENQTFEIKLLLSLGSVLDYDFKHKKRVFGFNTDERL